MGTHTEAEEISLGLMERGGLIVMISGALTIIGIILTFILEAQILYLLLAIEIVLGVAGFVFGIVVWGSGWMLRED